MVGADGQEPCHGEGGCERGVDHGVEEIEPCEGEVFKGTLFPDVWHEEGKEDERSDGVYVHGEL